MRSPRPLIATWGPTSNEREEMGGAYVYGVGREGRREGTEREGKGIPQSPGE